MRKKIYYFLLIIPILIGLSSSASAQIVVEDANSIWEKVIDSTEVPDISPHITVEYATGIFYTELIHQLDLPERITVEYATSIFYTALIPPPFDLPERIIIEYATSIASFNLSAPPYFQLCAGDFDYDGDEDGSDLAVFAADFGRTDCDTGEECEGDFDHDDDVDGSDLAVFAADFGRTDCSFY